MLIEYQLECCEISLPVWDLTVNPYVDTHTRETVACKYGYCKNCGAHRPKARLRFRVDNQRYKTLKSYSDSNERD